MPRKLHPSIARAMVSKRKRHSGGRSGRQPGALSDLPRCPCGIMLLHRAVARGHKCQED
jgi:hypothetical protein